MMKALTIIGIILAVIIVILLCVYLFVLQYPKLEKNPKVGKWYKITSQDMLCSDGSKYKAFFRKGSEKKVLIYFAGGGISDPEAVMVTGYSAGAGAASLLANDVFTNYFPNAESKTVLVDSMLMFIDNWHTISTDVWKSPMEISGRIKTNNIVLDSLTALHEDFGDDVTILFDCSVRDGELAKAQNLFDYGKPEVDESIVDIFQHHLKETIPQFEGIGAHFYIWDGLPFYDDPRNITKHTIIVTPDVYSDMNKNGISVAEWAYNATNGTAENYGLDLVN